MRVKMIPGKESSSAPNGIGRVISAYLKYGEKYGIEFVDSGEDLLVSHAGILGGECDVSILHGLYFTGDYSASLSEYAVNKRISESIRSSYAVTVPSSWVSEIIERDAKISPFVVPHGIDFEEWRNHGEHKKYVLYNKNRDGFDVCNSVHLDKLAGMAKGISFVSTFSRERPSNVSVIGVVPHRQMKTYIQEAGVFLSVTKETFGIATLEAISSGVPVLGWRYGGNIDIVQHGVNGYLATPNDYDDLFNGLMYCIDNRKVLSENAIETSKSWGWDNSISKLKEVFDFAIEKKTRKPSVSFVVPVYNYADKVERTIKSVIDQTHYVEEIIVVNDGSTDGFDEEKIKELSPNISVINKKNGGVATARNAGGFASKGKYLCFIDADDFIKPSFTKECVDYLEENKSTYIAYSGLEWITSEGKTGISEWPKEYNADDQVNHKNQIPTCCVMRREVFDRLGGYRQRYAPHGAGSEDADFWTRATIYGMGAKKVTNDTLFLYTAGSGNTSKKGYSEVDWTYWQPYKRNGVHPFVSLASPKKRWHDVYQYDEPVVSVVIPVSKYHTETIVNAIDSVEAQTYKKWELIVVLDTDIPVNLSFYPYAKILKTEKPESGPGLARNIGVAHSRGYFVVFLDADDSLEPSAIEKMVSTWNYSKSIVYTDYVGISIIEPENLSKFSGSLIGYDGETKIANIRHRSAAYICEKAQEQPVNPLYHWCLVTCLVPIEWHNSIGGFDEKMDSWEDVDYHWRLAKKGYCYSRIEEPLVFYRFNTGERREYASSLSGRQNASRLLQYMSDKYKEIENMPCQTCGGSSNSSVGTEMLTTLEKTSNKVNGVITTMADENFVLSKYMHPNRGDHPVVGPTTGLSYGYRSGGDSFLVHKSDIAGSPHLFRPEDAMALNPKRQEATPVEKPKSIVQEKQEEKIEAPVVSELEAIPGITPQIAEQMESNGIILPKHLKNLTVDDLVKYDGLGKARAKAIVDYVNSKL